MSLPEFSRLRSAWHYSPHFRGGDCREFGNGALGQSVDGAAVPSGATLICSALFGCPVQDSIRALRKRVGTVAVVAEILAKTVKDCDHAFGSQSENRAASVHAVINTTRTSTNSCSIKISVGALQE